MVVIWYRQHWVHDCFIAYSILVSKIEVGNIVNLYFSGILFNIVTAKKLLSQNIYKLSSG